MYALRPLTILVLTLMLGAIPQGAWATDCLAERREMKIGGGRSAILRNYFCQEHSGGNRTRLRVQFLRLTDHIASSVMDGTTPYIFRPIFAKARFVHTEVSREFDSLLRRFGGRSSFVSDGNCQKFSIRPPQGVGRKVEAAGCFKSSALYPRGATLRSLGGWDYQEGTDIPALDLVTGLRPGTGRWRYMTRRDLTDYRRNLRAYNRIAGKHNAGDVPRYIRMLEHISRASLPREFHFIVSQFNQGGCYNNGRLALIYQRPLRVYAVVFENVGDRPVTINSFLGRKAINVGLRRPMWAKDARRLGSSDLNLGRQRLGPGEKIVMFRRVAFGTNDDMRGQAKGLRPKPKLKSYAYGPEFHLAGFAVQGARFDFQKTPNNFLNLTMSSGGGSCPFLQAWSDKHHSWVDYGKVLHRAHGRSNKETDRKTFDGLKLRFRLVEKEAELAWIDSVALDLKLRSGIYLRLRPRIQNLNAPDGRFSKLYFGDKIDIRFVLPNWVAGDDVVTSTFMVSGYYERYATIFARRSWPYPPLRKAQFDKAPHSCPVRKIKHIFADAHLDTF